MYDLKTKITIAMWLATAFILYFAGVLLLAYKQPTIVFGVIMLVGGAFIYQDLRRRF